MFHVFWVVFLQIHFAYIFSFKVQWFIFESHAHHQMVSIFRIKLCIWCNSLHRWFAQRFPHEGTLVTLEAAFDDGRSGFRGGGCRRRQFHRYPCCASVPLSFPKETFYGVGGPSLPSPHEGEGLERPQVTRCEPCDLQRKTHWSTF